MKSLLILLLFLVCPAFAGEQQDVEKVLSKYKQAFQMNDWNTKIHLATFEEIKEHAQKDAVATSDWSYQTREGEIWVLRLSEYKRKEVKDAMGDLVKKRNFAKKDQKNSIVHELIHVVWAYANEEGAVSMLTYAIDP